MFIITMVVHLLQTDTADHIQCMAHFPIRGMRIKQDQPFSFQIRHLRITDLTEYTDQINHLSVFFPLNSWQLQGKVGGNIGQGKTDLLEKMYFTFLQYERKLEKLETEKLETNLQLIWPNWLPGLLTDYNNGLV